MKVSIIITAHNEEQSLPDLFKKITLSMHNQNYEYQVIVVDDGSSDGTWEKITTAAKTDKHISGIRFSSNQGQSLAQSAGIDKASGEILVFLDGDLQNDPKDIPKLVSQLNSEFDVVSGWRRSRKDSPIRVLPSMIANQIIRWIFNIPVLPLGLIIKAICILSRPFKRKTCIN